MSPGWIETHREWPDETDIVDSPAYTTSELMKRAGFRGISSEAVSPLKLTRVSRMHLPELCRDLSFTKGAEIGVWKAGYSALFCATAPKMHLLCVDSWTQYDGWDDGKASSAEKIQDAYTIAQSVLKGQNATIVQAFSEDAAADVPDGSLDLVYIDGNHLHDPVLADLAAWVPKVRSGGIVAGHDFRIFPDKPYIQVVPAVTDYTKAHGIDPWFLTSADKNPSWLWIVR